MTLTGLLMEGLGAATLVGILKSDEHHTVYYHDIAKLAMEFDPGDSARIKDQLTTHYPPLEGSTVRRQRVLLLSLSITMWWGTIWTFEAHARAQTRDTLKPLLDIGSTVARAVLSRDIATLLMYDRADLRSEDELELQKEKSNLECFLFETTCIHPPGRSIYEKLAPPHRLGITVIDLGKSPDGARYGLLLFYDQNVASERRARSRDFWCKEDRGRTVSSWTFKMVNGKWESAHPMFDSETDGLCG